MPTIPKGRRVEPIPRQDILATLRFLATRLGHTPRAVEVAEASSRLYKELFHHFDSMDDALQAAGLPPGTHPRRWSRERVVAELRKLDAAGYILSHQKLIDRGRQDVVNAAFTYWGGLAPARRAAKLPPPPQGRRGSSEWSVEEVVAQILLRHRRREPLASSKVPRMLRDAATYYLGGWREAIEKAGLDYEKVRLTRAAYHRREVIATLRTLATTRPRMTQTQVHRHRITSGIVRHFASLADALRAAKLADWPQVGRERMLTRADTLRLLKRRHADGRPMDRVRVVRDDPRLERAAARNFGGWFAALDAAGVPARAAQQPARRKR